MRFWKGLLLTLLCALLLCAPVLAGQIDPDKDCSLTVQCKHEVEDVTFAIWRVARVTDDVRFIKVDPFKASGVRVNDFDEWADIAETLAGYVESREIAPLETADTNKDGEAKFRDLETGLYLVMGDAYQVDDRTYQPVPFLVALPNNSDGDWDYTLVTSPKPSERLPEQDTITLEVLKIWRGDDSGVARPASVTIHLLKDGQLFDTVVLNQANNWEHLWTGLDPNALWRVSESEIPAGYTVLVERTGSRFVVINTYGSDEPDDPTPPPTPPTPPTPPVEPQLPETGTLQWLTPLLLGAGALLFLLGLLRRRQEG